MSEFGDVNGSCSGFRREIEIAQFDDIPFVGVLGIQNRHFLFEIGYRGVILGEPLQQNLRAYAAFAQGSCNVCAEVRCGMQRYIKIRIQIERLYKI